MFARHALYRLTAAEKIARDVGAQHAINAFSGQIFNSGLLKQNACIVDQRGKGLTFAIEAVKHGHDLRFIANVCTQGKCFSTRLNDLIDDVLCGFDIVVIVHRHGITFASQLQRGGFANAAAGAGDQCNCHCLLPIKKPGGGFALPGLRYYSKKITGIRSSAHRSRTGYGRRIRHQDASRSASIYSPRLPGRQPVHGNNRDSTRPPSRAGCAER
ncbi:hypothetical protein ENKOMM052M1_14955 [Enterobacter kobei]